MWRHVRVWVELVVLVFEQVRVGLWHGRERWIEFSGFVLRHEVVYREGVVEVVRGKVWWQVRWRQHTKRVGIAHVFCVSLCVQVGALWHDGHLRTAHARHFLHLGRQWRLRGVGRVGGVGTVLISWRFVGWRLGGVKWTLLLVFSSLFISGSAVVLSTASLPVLLLDLKCTIFPLKIFDTQQQILMLFSEHLKKTWISHALFKPKFILFLWRFSNKVGHVCESGEDLKGRRSFRARCLHVLCLKQTVNICSLIEYVGLVFYAGLPSLAIKRRVSQSARHREQQMQ